MFVSLQDETRSCYVDTGKRPIKRVQNGGTEYTVSGYAISQAMAKGLDIRVMIIYGMHSSVHMKLFELKAISFLKTSHTFFPHQI